MNISLPKKIFFAAIVIILFSFVCYLVFLLVKGSSSVPTTTTISPTSSPNSSYRRPLEYPKTRSIPFSITSINPPEDKTGTYHYSPIKDIIVTFNKEINPKKVSLSVTPSIVLEVRMGKNGQEVLISPPAPSFWKPGVLYTITIESSTEALDGTVLPSNRTYSIMTTLDPGGE